jgi:chemotaxis protein methyltransferase CheR
MRIDSLPDALWPRLSKSLAEKMGLNFPPERRTDLQRGLADATKAFGFADMAACADWVLSEPLTAEQLQSLAGHFTIGETYFFRDRNSFDALAQQVLPGVIRLRRGREQRLRLWSAACSTGEEAYSLAIVLHELLPDWDEWSVSILATDINPRSLQRARAGIYGAWSFRDCSAEFKQRYFTAMSDGRLALSPSIRNRVSFEPLNLSEDSFPSLASGTNAMDLILCRNLLMYFTPEHARRLIEKLHRALFEDGWLVVSASECSQELFSAFRAVNRPGAILYRKRSGLPAATPTAMQHTAVTLSLGRIQTAHRLYDQGRYAEASATLSRPIAPPPESSEVPAPVAIDPAPAYSLLARALANQGNLADALAACERWIAADKFDASAHYLHAMILQEQGNRSVARRSLQRALYLDPNHALAHFALGHCARNEGDDAQARRHFDNALQLLRARPPGDPVPDSDGLSAGRLAEIIATLLPTADAS